MMHEVEKKHLLKSYVKVFIPYYNQVFFYVSSFSLLQLLSLMLLTLLFLVHLLLLLI